MKKTVIVLIAAALCACGPNYSNGERIGIVTKLSEKGVIFKSWEGEMLIALPVAVAGTTQPDRFDFNVDPLAVEDVQKAMTSGKRVKLIYRQWWFRPWTIDNDHVIIKVESVD